MQKENFAYMGHDVVVEAVQPLFADGWLWRLFVDGLLVRQSSNHLRKTSSQAVEEGVQESKRILHLLHDSGWN